MTDKQLLDMAYRAGIVCYTTKFGTPTVFDGNTFSKLQILANLIEQEVKNKYNNR